ncbi:MAG: DUF547 domain-containing protein [Planctomycetes bacterium]|nr:DUF547 domain-containing protein [Planctomycetota bacterium]
MPLFLRSLVLVCLAVCAAGSSAVVQKPAEGAFDQSHRVWTEVLAAHVKGDRFDYKELQANRAKLDQYLGALQSVTRDEFERWTKEQRYAFWINAYNAYTIHLIVKSYPLDSIKDLGGLFKSVWDKPFIPLGHLFPDAPKKELTLNNIEHDVLRPKFVDARVHAAINCASRGCPPLRNEAFVAEKLDAQLDGQVRAWLADTNRNRFDQTKSKAQVSEIFSWFKEDFVRDAGSVREWLARYAPEDQGKWIREAGKELDVSYLDYSWKLNDVERPKR